MWNQISRVLENSMDPAEFQTWISCLTYRSSGDNLVLLTAPNKFVAAWVADHYIDQIQNAFKRIFDFSPEIRIEQRNFSIPVMASRPSNAAANTEKPQEDSKTFHSFILAKENHFAYALCMKVADHPAHLYNPVYLFSSVSAGKSHLLRAIRHTVLHHNPEARVEYLTADEFTALLVRASREQRLDEWKRAYADLHVLLFDDLDQLEGRQGSQKELLFLFDRLYRMKRQIVLAGKYPLNHLEKIMPELRSRLQWGVFAELGSPSQELKMNILRNHAASKAFQLPEDVAFFLAAHTQDLKSLEQRCVAIETHLSLQSGTVDISNIRRIIDRKQAGNITASTIQKLTCELFGISLSDLLSETKTRRIAYPRQLAIFLTRKWTKLSFKDIGKAFGNKDHSTIIYAVQRIEKIRNIQPGVFDDIRRLESLLA